MSDFEDFIRKNRDEFDSLEPDSGHLTRFRSRLEAQQPAYLPQRNRWIMLKIAALILILISITVFVFEFATLEIRERFSSSKPDTELPAEIREAVQYYENQTNTQLKELKSLVANNSEAQSLSENAISEIRKLDISTTDLKKTLSSNPGNEQILDAIVRNQQMKEVILANIIKQLSQSQQY